MILGKMHKKMEYNYCLMNKFLGALFSGLLFCGILQAESSLPGVRVVIFLLGQIVMVK
jgi:hypothetical protein